MLSPWFLSEERLIIVKLFGICHIIEMLVLCYCIFGEVKLHGLLEETVDLRMGYVGRPQAAIKIIHWLVGVVATLTSCEDETDIA